MRTAKYVTPSALSEVEGSEICLVARITSLLLAFEQVRFDG